MIKEKHFYVIEENIKNPKMFELKTQIYNDRYIRFNQNSLKDCMEKKNFKKLLKNGLFMNKKERDYDAYLTMQRLVGSLYGDISDKEMHHIDKNKFNNSIVNLVPLESGLNKSIDSLPLNEMLEFGRIEHEKWMQNVNSNKRNTLSNNDNLILDILSNSINKNRKAVHKIFKKKIKSIQIIGTILSTFFYKKEFLKYLKDNKDNVFGN